MKKMKFKISDMHCTSCAINIDGELEDTAGVKKAQTNYAKQLTEVEFEDDKITPQKVVQIIKSAGYTATPIEN